MLGVHAPENHMTTQPRLDRVGEWSVEKLEIVRKYAAAYSTIMSKQPGFTHHYIDGFAGAGEHISKTTGNLIPGSALNVLAIKPPFDHYVLVDKNRKRVENLKQLIGARTDVEFLQGDCSTILLKDVLPQIQYQRKRRALCLLDPYGVHLEWAVIEMAGKLGTVDLLLNFPTMDMNMNALLTDPRKVNPREAARMTRFWGDESWKQITYRPRAQGNLFGETEKEKASNDDVVEAFCTRLKGIAGFQHVAKPVPMRNSTNTTLYYLVFASANKTACKIMQEIFRPYRKTGTNPLSTDR